ncbi:guanylate-binding protein 1-like [Branchiostoma floridae]|uniref:Guanylate-binding protein 1-like n=1 Tax=Branchiostoma floridae TaxID=7739 RepID=A0A9J7HQ64_BRAFL|nr:guanylate-binding protein 1-like [Branchiostoma floridae]
MASAQGSSSPVKCGLSPRSKLYSKINEHLSEDQVKSLRAMLITDHHIGKGKIENATPHEIFTMLEADNKIGEGNLGLLKDLLIALKEIQLAKEVDDLERDQRTGISKLHSEFGFKVEELKPKGGGHVVPGSSIPLILPNDLKYNASTGAVQKIQDNQRTSLHVVPEALELLEGIEEPVSVQAICGPCRSGKSYILSRLLGTADAFELGHRMDPQTFGIWMGTKVLRGKDFTIVLLDTEGIDAVTASAGQDASILVMTILLSSRLIYNSLNVPHMGDLEKMQCFIKLATGVTVKQGEASNVSAFRKFFPDFMWLLRDVSLKMEDENGKEMDPSDYLVKRVFRRNPNAFEESTTDMVRRAILTFFPSAECAILERPSDKKEVMNNIAQHTDSLNPEFNKGVDDLVVRLLLKARAKRGYHEGSKVSGLALSIMTKQYVEAVNDPNSIPALDNTWQNTIELMQNRAIEEAVMEYNKQMQAQIAEARMTKNGEVPLEEGEIDTPIQPTIMGLHNASVKTVTSILLKKVGHFQISTGNQGTENQDSGEINAVVDQMQKRLVQQEERAVDGIRGLVVTGGELFHYIQQNREHSKNFCKGLYEHLLDPIRKRVESPPPDFDFDKLTRELAAAREQYKKQARGPEKWVVLQEMDTSAVKLQAQIDKMGYQKKLMQQQQRAHEAELRAKEREEEILNQLKQLKDQLQTQRETLQEIIQQYERQITQMKQDMEERHAVALQRIEDLKNAKMAEQAEIARDLLEKERASTREKIKKMENEQADLYRQLEEVLDQQKKATPPPKPSLKEKCTIS